MTLFALRARDDLLAVRFAISPLWETQAAVQAFADERGRSYHEPWLMVARARAARLDLAPLLAVLPRRGYVPDFLTPPPRTCRPGLRGQLARSAWDHSAHSWRRAPRQPFGIIVLNG
jgi:hypothetical protein